MILQKHFLKSKENNILGDCLCLQQHSEIEIGLLGKLLLFRQWLLLRVWDIS